jgi:hypothetical protein
VIRGQWVLLIPWLLFNHALKRTLDIWHVPNGMARAGLEMSESASRRDNTIVAWHEVPGKRPSKENSVSVFDISSLQSSDLCAHLPESHRTLRDGFSGVALSRHFVPGYDHTVPPGQKPLASSKGSRIKSALMGSP